MKKVAPSIVLACANFIVLGLEYIADLMLPKQLPYSVILWLGTTLPALVPLLLFATVGFAMRDVFRPSTRWQAIAAFVLSVFIGIVYFRPG
jgi:hypothetical protein